MCYELPNVKEETDANRDMRTTLIKKKYPLVSHFGNIIFFQIGWLNPVIGEEYSLSDARKAQEEVIQHTSGTKGKIVLTLD